MGLLSTVAGWFRGKSGEDVGNVLDDRNFNAMGDWGPSNSGVNVNSATAMRHVAVMACVSLLSEDLAKIPVGVYRRMPDGGKERVRDHELNRLLRKPNNWQTGFEWKEMMQASLVLRGNAFSVAIRNGRGAVLYLVPIHPDRVTLWEAPNGEWFFAVTRNGLHEIAVLRDQHWLIPAEDMLHIRWLSQWNSLLGSSRLSMVRESIGLSIGMEEHQARFVGQGARASGVLSTEQKFASPEVRNQLREEFQRLQSGPRNAGAIAVLEQGLKWEALGLTMVDAQFIESRNFQIRDIARAFGVPPYKIAVEGETEGPAMVQMGQEYLNGPVSGYCERWTAKLEQFWDIDGEEIYVDWDYAHFLKADLLSRYTAKRQATQGPWMSVNEARRDEGLPDKAGGDVVLQPANMVPLGTVPAAPTTGGGAGSEQTGAPAEGGDGDALRDPADDKPDQ